MKTKTTLTLALAAFASFSAWSDTIPSAGTITFADGSANELTNVVGGALCLTDADLKPTTAGSKPVSIAFDVNRPGHAWGSTTIKIVKIDLSLNADFTVTSASGITLEAVGTNSVFALTQTGSKRCTFKGLTFKGANQSDDKHAPYDGGAINLDGGSLFVDKCSFTDFVTRFSGGAVSARRLEGDAVITNGCTFTRNRAHPINGYGGALYVSRQSGIGKDAAVARIYGSSFTGNSAENGGAVCAMTVVYDDEVEMKVVIDAGSVFSNNTAVYEGGAVISEAGVTVGGSNTLFLANFAGLSGGAICVTGVENDFPLPCQTHLSAATFADNHVGTNWTWSVGGAVAILPSGCELKLDDRVLFTNNYAKTTSTTEPVFGGAVYTGEDVTNDFLRAYFVDNRVQAADDVWNYGGALSAEGGVTKIDTCVFDSATNGTVKCYGSAVDLNNVDYALIRNSTFRHGVTEALSVYDGATYVTNCVLVGNALGLGSTSYAADINVEGDGTFGIAYSAVSNLIADATVAFTQTNNLGKRAASEIYAGNTVKLRGTGFNPVAGLGLVQSVKDYDGVTYGSKATGYSMGAYETPTEKLVLVLHGQRDYDGTTGSNTCVWSWSTYTNRADAATGYDWSDFVPDAAASYGAAYDITSWVFGSKEPGYYASTNATLTASIAVKTGMPRATWLNTLITTEFTGQIDKAKDIKGYLSPEEFAWTGSEIKPGPGGNATATVIVSNTVDNLLVDPNDYYVTWAFNVNPTNDVENAKGAQLIITCTNRYDAVYTNYFAITAYRTEYTYCKTDGTLVESYVTTNGSLSGSNVVAKLDERTNYCLDYQYSTTNGVVYLCGKGGTGKPDVTTLKMLYEQDTVGTGSDPNVSDGVPDKYQKKIILATVNGEWTGSSNAYDRVRWVTLTNSTTAAGKWDAVNGKCTLTSALVGFDGVDARYGFDSTGTWPLASGNPVGQTISASGFPIYFYKPDRSDSPGSRTGGNTDGEQQSLKSLGATLTALGADGDDATYEAALAITDFAMDNGALAGIVEAQILKNGSIYTAMELAASKIEILGAVELGDDWFVVGTATTDASGAWSVTRTRETRSLSATRTSTGDRTAEWTLSDATQPKFFKIRLVEE